MAFWTGLANLYIYCVCGEMTTGSYAKMTSSVYEANWPVLHARLQKYVHLMIANMQRPVYYDGFGVSVLNLETFYAVNQYKN